MLRLWWPLPPTLSLPLPGERCRGEVVRALDGSVCSKHTWYAYIIETVGYTWSENYHPRDELCQAPPSPGGTTASKQKEALGGVRISILLSGIQKCPLSARRVDHIHHRPTYLSLTKRMTYGCSVAQSCPILWPHGLQHTRLPCPSRSPRACSNSCPLSQ